MLKPNPEPDDGWKVTMRRHYEKTLEVGRMTAIKYH